MTVPDWTDLQTMESMFTSRGIEYDRTDLENGNVALEVPGGYPGFYTRMTFGPDGGLRAMEAFE